MREKFVVHHKSTKLTSPMNETKLVEIFVDCDDFCKEFEQIYQQMTLPFRHPHATRTPGIHSSEIMSIAIYYHLSGMKCFQYYYEQCVLKSLKSYFPKAPSYSRFIELMPRCFFLLFAFLHRQRRGMETGIYFADSKKLAVCHNLRIFYHRVFKGIAQRGKSSTGWFYGLKLFLVINCYGQIMQCSVTAGNTADNNESVLKKFFQKLKGKLFADKGFLSQKIFSHCLEHGLKIITKIRSNMKNKLMLMDEKLLLAKRGMIESALDIMMTVCDIDHTRHRSPVNSIVNLFAGLNAYTYLDKLPSVFAKKIKLI